MNNGEPLNILFFVHRFYPSIGGVEKYIYELSRSLLASGHEVTVVAGDHTGSLPPSESCERIAIRRFPATRSPLRCRLHLLRMRSLFRHADVISVSNTHMLEYYWRMLGPFVDMRKLFLIRHGMSCVYPVPVSDAVRAKRSLGLVRGVVHDGHFIEKWLKVRANLCPDQGLSPEADTLEPVAEPPPTFASFVGRLEPDSGIRLYIEAVRILTREYGRSFHLDVYGDGSLLPTLRAVVARDALPVRFHGRTPNAQEFLSRSCFAFVDGRMAIQEAMARRRVVVAAYVDPLKRDYVSGEAFSPYLFSACDARTLAETVRRLIDRPEERSAAVQRAFEHARTLQWSRTADEIVGLWREKLAAPWAGPTLWRRLWLSIRMAKASRVWRRPTAPNTPSLAECPPQAIPALHPIG